MPQSSSLELSTALQQRILAASSVLRLSPDAFLVRLLSQYYNTLGGLPRDLLRYILTFLDYSTISGILTRVCRLWQECVVDDPLHFFARLRQMHGIHLLDPVHGLFYFPRALKRVVIESKAGASASPSAVANAASSTSTGSGAAAAAASGAGGTSQGLIPLMSTRTNADSSAAQQQQQDVNSPQVVPASSFLTVDIRTQNTKSLPWDYARETVQWAIERERMIYGEIRSPNLQQSEGPVWSQAATVAYDRRIFMFGGETYEGVVLGRAYEYDPMTRHWGVLPALSEKRAAASAVAYAGHIFVFGGYNAEGSVLDTYEVLAVEARTWISQTYSPQCFFKQQRTRTQVDAAASPETLPQDENVARENNRGHAPRAACSAGVAVAGALWPFTEGSPPGWMASGRRCSVSSQYRMPEKVCGTAVAVHGNVFLFAGGYQCRIAPEQTAVSYSAVSSALTTPMHVAPGGVAGGPNSDVTSSTTSTSAANTPLRLPRSGSVSMAGQVTAESSVWVFCPRTGRWWTQGPRLPSPRAFGAMAVLELPILGPCLCYFGGCAKADAPETAMLYIPLRAATETRALADAVAKDCAGGDAKSSFCVSSPSDAAKNGAAKSRQDGTGGDVADAAKPPGVTVPTAVAATRLRRAAATLTRVEDRGGAGSRREEACGRGAEHRGCRDAQAAPVAAVGSDAVAHNGPSGTERCATGEATRVAAPESRGSAIGSRRTSNEPLQLMPTTLAPHRRLQRSRAECMRDASRPMASADNGDALGSGGDDDGAFWPGGEADMTMIWRCFRNPIELPWQRYVRIPIGGAFTSVAVLGAQHSRSLVLTGFYPTPNIGFCKVDHLLPLDAFLPLLGALSPPLAERAYAESPPSTGQETDATRARGNTPTPLKSTPPIVAGSASGAARAAVAASFLPMREAGQGLPDEAAMAVNHWHQEREWNHHQRREIWDMVRSAAHAATMRHPRSPQTAGEEHNWSLAPVPEVRVVNRSGPSPLRVSWKVQTLNAKVIVGME
ncbi:hypothetical protein CUR178_04946 [Leishmania enriettii]|uniref:F-box domain-containing protein n=1 Tax=Leishmania enriettii TaxID=5663 RepID=A0A836GN82_LEIEN|nr:hypothetical protein CUR178_04946 [Leishmania enriettii]